jgi:hypothetical protein
VRSLALALLLVLGACAGTAETRANNALAAACDSYATVLEQLVPFKADLTLTQIGRVDAANTIAAAPCASDSALDPAAAVGAVNAAIGLIQAVTGEAS